MAEPLFNLSQEANLEERGAEEAQLTEQKIAHENGAEAAPEFYWAEGVPGQGPRPDYLPAKFESAEQAVKAYGELEKKFGGFVGAPESYDFVTPLEQHGLEWDKESEVGKDLAGVLKQYNASQEFAEALMGVYAKDMSARAVTAEDVLTNLGDDGKRMINTISNYAAENLTPEETHVLETMMMDSEQVKLVNKLFVNLFGDPQLASPQDVNAYTPVRNEQTIRAEMDAAIKNGSYDGNTRERLLNELAKVVAG